ncbi:MAG: hypothetical protein F2923_02905 [Actinobacteria bacterium]|uniref:Unannotated protein n=1 Tax=freshwater metagenome TaxID=449393 RepID=A0A6J7G3X8_9ZZZZ|nr:hypothetical protein [Actinomycetota bacterium]MTB27571.1 hypothetical protein [Actinomycetota bacterium]
MKKVATFLAIAGACTVVVSTSAFAMGSGNIYVDTQVGVTYTVYQPTVTTGLKLTSKSNLALPCASGAAEENLATKYGTKTQILSLTEGNPMCSDIGQGATVLTTKVQGATAKVQAYCDPALSLKCTVADVSKFGGHLDVKLPAIKGLRPTRVWIETTGKTPLSAQQLVTIAKGLQPVQ